MKDVPVEVSGVIRILCARLTKRKNVLDIAIGRD